MYLQRSRCTSVEPVLVTGVIIQQGQLSAMASELLRMCTRNPAAVNNQRLIAEPSACRVELLRGVPIRVSVQPRVETLGGQRVADANGLLRSLHGGAGVQSSHGFVPVQAKTTESPQRQY